MAPFMIEKLLFLGLVSIAASKDWGLSSAMKALSGTFNANKHGSQFRPLRKLNTEGGARKNLENTVTTVTDGSELLETLNKSGPQTSKWFSVQEQALEWLKGLEQEEQKKVIKSFTDPRDILFLHKLLFKGDAANARVSKDLLHLEEEIIKCLSSLSDEDFKAVIKAAEKDGHHLVLARGFKEYIKKYRDPEAQSRHWHQWAASIEV